MSLGRQATKLAQLAAPVVFQSFYLFSTILCLRISCQRFAEASSLSNEPCMRLVNKGFALNFAD